MRRAAFAIVSTRAAKKSSKNKRNLVTRANHYQAQFIKIALSTRFKEKIN